MSKHYDETVNIVAYKPRYPVINYLPAMSTGVHAAYDAAYRRTFRADAQDPIVNFLVEHGYCVEDLEPMPCLTCGAGL